MKNKVAFIIPYFGKFPDYFPLFLKSIEDQAFDILLFSDNENPAPEIKNLHAHKLSFNTIKQLITDKLQCPVNFNSGYKLCDFKPMYGLVFEEYLAPYHFWGTVDIDTIVGNFTNFLPDEILDTIDFYSGVKEYVSGSFFILRNNEKCNNLFKKSRDWQQVVTNPQHVSFDECGGHYYEALRAGKSIFELNTKIQSFTEVVLAEEKAGNIRAVFTNSILEPKGMQPVTIQKNKVLYGDKEYLMIHFIYYKTKYYFYTKTNITTTPYYICSLGIFKYRPTPVNVLFSINFGAALLKKAGNVIRKITK